MATSAFRYHDSVPPRILSPYYARLVREWVELNASRRTAATVGTWAAREPALAGFRRPSDVVDAIDAAPGLDKDVLLLALIRLTQNGDQLAGRTVLQAMLPKIGRLTRRTSTTGTDDAWIEDRRHIVVATLWQVIADYPIGRRQTSVAANLALDTLHRVTQGTRGARADVPVSPEVIGILAGAVHDELVLPGELPETPDLDAVLRWAVERHVLTRDEAVLLARVYIGEGTTTQRSHEAARAMGITFRTVRNRARIARGHLTAALAEVRTQAIPR